MTQVFPLDFTDICGNLRSPWSAHACAQHFIADWLSDIRDYQNPGEFPDNPTDDYDGDGLTEQSGDCDDLNPEVLGPSTWYADSDGDGYGDSSQSVVSCLNELLALDETTNYVEKSDDCDDSDAETYPAAAEKGANSVSEIPMGMAMGTARLLTLTMQAQTATTAMGASSPTMPATRMMTSVW